MQFDGSESAFRDVGMKNLARRALFTIGAFVSLAVLSFLGIDALPGDGCTALLGRFGTEAKIAECRVEHHLNDPVVVRLGSWASDVVQGDLGYSIKRDEQVAQIVLPRIRNTAMLALVAALMAFPTAIVAGLLIGRFPRSRIGRAINTLGVVAMTLPEFVIATILWLVFSIWIPIFPGVTVVPSNATFVELLPHIWMPALTLAAVVFAHSMRTMKAGVTTIQAMPFVESARLR